MASNAFKHLFENPEDFPQLKPGDLRSSVHYSQTYRIDKAREQVQHAPVSPSRIAELVNETLKDLGLNQVAHPLIGVDPSAIDPDGMVALDYDRIAEEHQLADRRDVVNIRFDREGHPVVVAVSDDVNFCPVPEGPDEFDAKEDGKWKYSTAAVILSALGSDWDRSQFLLFPLSGLAETEYSRHDVEQAIGNGLLQSGECRLLDKFSHCY